MLHVDNRARALQGLNLSGKAGVEIGPLNRPIVSKSQYNVLYADHCSTEELRARYLRDANVNVEQIVPIDFDLTKGGLSEQLSHPVDYIVASHVIEHVPDMIGWLREMQSILQPGGVIALVIPDMRFTFDLHRRLTPFWRLKQAFDAKLSRPSLQMVMDHFMCISPVDTQALWNNYASKTESAFVDADALTWDPSALITHWKEGHYIDTHCLITTPWHFLEVMGAATRVCGVDLDLKWIEPTEFNGLEFYLQLCNPVEGSGRTDWLAEAEKIRRTASRPEVFA